MPKRSLALFTLVLGLGLTACGGDDGGDDAATTTEAGASATTAARAAATTEAAGGGGSGGELADRVCELLREVNGKLNEGAAGPAYLAQFAMGAAGRLTPEEMSEIGPTIDEEVRARCEADLDEFLDKADITSLGRL
jgi:hypothetical protein